MCAMASAQGSSAGAWWFAVGVFVMGSAIALAAMDHRHTRGRARTAVTQPTASDLADFAAKTADPVIGVVEDPVLARAIPGDTLPIPMDRDRTADELLTGARKALEAGKSTEAYRLATLSVSKKRTEAALEIKARAACRLGGKGAARSASESLSRARRRAVRRECREHGIRLGL
jgi:hypothetical protein